MCVNVSYFVFSVPVCLPCYCLVVSTSAIDCLEKPVAEMTYNVSSETLNLTNSLTYFSLRRTLLLLWFSLSICHTFDVNYILKFRLYCYFFCWKLWLFHRGQNFQCPYLAPINRVTFFHTHRLLHQHLPTLLLFDPSLESDICKNPLKLSQRTVLFYSASQTLCFCSFAFIRTITNTVNLSFVHVISVCLWIRFSCTRTYSSWVQEQNVKLGRDPST